MYNGFNVLFHFSQNLICSIIIATQAPYHKAIWSYGINGNFLSFIFFHLLLKPFFLMCSKFINISKKNWTMINLDGNENKLNSIQHVSETNIIFYISINIYKAQFTIGLNTLGKWDHP
jgi:hypothetical protein